MTKEVRPKGEVREFSHSVGVCAPDEDCGECLIDLFPGSGAVTRAWEAFCAAPTLPFPEPERTEPMESAA
jgi:hypothetical protein